MAISAAERKAFNYRFVDAFTDEEALGQEYRDRDPSGYDQVISEAIEEFGFGRDANPYNVVHELRIRSRLMANDWTDLYLFNHQINSDEEAEQWSSTEQIIDFILSDLHRVVLIPDIIDDIEQWTDRNPDVEVLSRAIDEYFDENEAVRLVPHYDPSYEKKVYAELRYQGFSPRVEPYQVESSPFSVNVDSDAAAAKLIDRAIDTGSLYVYATKNMMMDLVEYELLDYDITIYSEPGEI